MNKICLSITFILSLLFSSCSREFLDISPTNSITDNAVWKSGTATKMFVNDVYNSTLTGPLYRFTAINNRMFDHLFTDDMGYAFDDRWNTFNFSASNAPFERWSSCYSNIRKTNLGIQKIAGSDALTNAEKERFLGDMHFLRAMLYLELFRFYGGVPIITEALNRNEDEIFYARNTAEETLLFIIEEFQIAADKLPINLDSDEYGRATKGAALGMKAVAYLHGAGTVDAKYYEDAAAASNVFITGELQGRYDLFGKGETDPLMKRQAFANLFLEPYEGNEEVIFDVQYAYPYKTQGGFQTIVAPGAPGVNNAYGWGFSAPTQNIVDAFEMKDGSTFDWNNPAHAANPYLNRDERLYASVLYHGVEWKGAILSLSSNRFDNGVEVSNNLPNGLFSTKNERTKTGYFVRKHQNEEVICGPENRNGIGDGGNLIVLRYAEILLTYAEAKNEVSGPDGTVYDAINQIRRRAGQPDLPLGLDQAEMRKRIHRERRVELAFENKRFFDITRWNEGNVLLNAPLMGMNAKYVKDPSTGEIKISYTPFKVVDKQFSSPTNNLLPIPLSALNQNPKLIQNPGW